MLREAIATDPAKPMVRLDLAKVLREAGRRDEARAEYEAMLQLEPDRCPALTGLGVLLAGQGDLAGAEATLRRALRASPGRGQARFNLAQVLERRGRSAERGEYRSWPTTRRPTADEKAARSQSAPAAQARAEPERSDRRRHERPQASASVLRRAAGVPCNSGRPELSPMLSTSSPLSRSTPGWPRRACPPVAAPVRPPVVEPLAPTRYQVRFTASAELREKLERLQALMRFSVPDGDLARIIDIAVTEKLQRVEAKRFAKTKAPRRGLAQTDTTPSSRHIPAAVRRLVHERDGGRCGYRDKYGRRCDKLHDLEFHHKDGGDHAGRRPACASERIPTAQERPTIRSRDAGDGLATVARA